MNYDFHFLEKEYQSDVLDSTLTVTFLKQH